MSDLPAIKTRVAGVSFENRDGGLRQTYVRLIRKGDRLILRREQDNPFDGSAIAVDWADADGQAFQIGYVPRGLALVLAPLVDQGAQLHGTVIRTGGGGLSLLGVRMKIEGDLSRVPDAQRTGLEPAIAWALAVPDDDNAGAGLAPALSPTRSDAP